MQTAHRKWLVLGVVSTALLLIVIDMTVLYTALPTLTHDLAASASAKLWIVNAYALTVSGLLLGMGTLGDRVGHRTMFVAGLVVFGIASACAAYAPTAAILIAARVGLGVGAAMMMPATLAIIRVTFTDERERSLAIGIWASVASGGAAFGPVVGGLLLEHFWWGSVFLINVPVVLLALLMTRLVVPATPGHANAPWDLMGSLQVMAGLTSLAYAIKEVATRAPAYGWAAVATGVGVVALASFVRRQRRSATPLVDFTLFRDTRFSGGVIAALVAAITLIGVELVFSQRLQLVLGLSPLEAGLTLLPIPLAAFATGPVAGLLLPRLGAHRVIVGGLMTTALGLGLLMLAPDGLSPMRMAALILLGVGVGATMTAASNAIMNNAPAQRAGMAASVEEVSYELGGALGIALLGSALSAVYSAAMVVPEGMAVSVVVRDSIDEALLAAESLPAHAADTLVALARQAFDQAFGVVLVVALGLSLLAAAAVAVLNRPASRVAVSTAT